MESKTTTFAFLAILFASCCCANSALLIAQNADTTQTASSSTDSANTLYNLAATYYGDQDWDAAEREFRNLLEHYPDDDLAMNARFYLGETLIQLNQNQKAEALFDELLERDPHSQFAVRSEFRLAECKYLRNDFENAKRLFQTFVDSHSGNPLTEFALPYLGELHLRASEISQARDVYQEALNKFPNSGLSHKSRLGLAQSLHRLGQYGEAERFYRFLSAQTTNPLGDDAQMMLGKMLVEQGNWDAAKTEFEQLIGNFPESELLTEATYMLAKHQMSEGQWETAWTTIQPLLTETVDDDFHVRLNLDAAVIAVRVDQLGLAEKRLEIAREKPLSKGPAEFAAVVEIDIANRRKDIKTLQRLVTSFQSNYYDSVHLTRCIEPLARMHYDRGEFAQAAARYQHLIELVSVRPQLADNVPAWRYLLGLSRIGTSEFDVALKQLKAIQDFRNDQQFQAATSFAIATAHSGKQQNDLAIPYYRQYLEMLPTGDDAVRCQADLAIALTKTNQLTEAVNTLDNVIETHPNDLSVLGACEIVAEAALKEKQNTVAQKFFHVMASSNHTQFASRGANGLVWADDASMLSTEKLNDVIASGIDSELAVEAVVGKIQKLQADNQHDKAVEILQSVITNHPESQYIDEAKFRMAVSLQRIGGPTNSQQSAELLTQFLKDNPKHELADLAEYELAWALHDTNQTEKARNQFDKIAVRFPSSEFKVDALYRTAMLSRQLGDDARAKQRLLQLINYAPNDSLASYANYTLGEFETENQNWDKAIRLFETVIRESTATTLIQPARYWLAESYFQSGQTAKAEAEFTNVSAIEFDKPEITSVIWLRLAQCAGQRADWDRVEEIAKARQKVANSHTPAYQYEYLLGRVEMSRANFIGAREKFTTAIKHPEAKGTQTAAMSQWMIGETWFHQELYKDALRAYLLVDSLYEYDEWRGLALLQATKCQYQLGQLDRAIRTCNRLLSSFPDSTHSQQARQLLDELVAAQDPPNKTQHLPATFSKQ